MEEMTLLITHFVSSPLYNSPNKAAAAGTYPQSLFSPILTLFQPPLKHQRPEKGIQSTTTSSPTLMALLFHPHLFIYVVTVAAIITITRGTYTEWSSATATYTPDTESTTGGGACGYGDMGRSGYGSNVAGLSRALFGKGSVCGGCFELRCVDHIRWCLLGSPSVVITATDFCAPNYGLPADYGGWCNYPQEHFEMSESAFAQMAVRRADIVPVQYRRVNCERNGGMRFTIGGSAYFHQVLIINVGSDGEVVAVKVKGWRTAWIPMGRNWGQNWQCNADLSGQSLSFEVTSSSGRTVTSYDVAPSNWRFGQTFEGKQSQQTRDRG